MFILIPEEEFRRLQALSGEVVGIEEQRALLSRLGHDVGWDDPAMNVYDDR